MSDYNPSSLAALFSQEDADRREHLMFARECAKYTDPYLLPRESPTENEGYERNFQSLGARGMEAIASTLHFSLLTPGMLWFSNDLTPEIVRDSTLPREVIEQERMRLFMEDMAVHAVMEGGILGEPSHRGASTFHTGTRSVIIRNCVMGESLVHIEEDGRLRNFRLDNFTTRRDSSGSVVCHVIKESVDPMSLDDETLAKADLKREEFEGKHVKHRCRDMYTLVEYQPLTKKWIIRQELNNKTVRTRDESVCSYIGSSIRLQEGENYGRGLFSLWLGDLRTLDAVRSAVIDLAFAASKMLVAINHGSDTKPDDIAKPNGSVIYANVQAGAIQDIAFLKTDKMADFRIAQETAQMVESNLGQAMGLFNSMIRDSERTTRFEVEKVTSQAQYITGGAISWLDETFLRPLVHAYRALCREKEIIRPASKIEKQFARTSTLTGVAQVARRAKAQGIFENAQLAQILGPEAQQYIDASGSFEAYMRLTGNYIDGTIRSEKEVQANKDAEMKRQMAVNAAGPVVQEAAAVGADAARSQLGLTTQ